MSTLRTVAAAVVVAACSADSVPSEPQPSSWSAPDGCDVAIETAVTFFANHPAGPAGLDAAEANSLSELVADVEGQCPPPKIATFGSEHLEPWSASGQLNDLRVTTPATPSR